MLRIVAATKLTEQEFAERSLLALSCPRLVLNGNVTLDIEYNNSAPLPTVFNAAIQRAADDETILFTHDDVRFDDWHLIVRLAEALRQFPVVGLAGNRRRLPRQPSWAYTNMEWTVDSGFLSGAVAHTDGINTSVTYYGKAPAEVKLIDGVFIAAKVRTLREANVTFDPRFRFDFYDLDFCRSCEQAGLQIGTWQIAVSHASGGDFNTPHWRQAYADYLAKWGE